MNTDEQSIRLIVKQLEENWNSGNSSGFAAPFAENAEFVDILGRHHQGRTTIEAGHRQIFDTIYRGSQNSYTVEHVRFVRPDVAIAFIHASLLSRLGGAVDDAQRSGRLNCSMSKAEARPTLVLSKKADEWEIVAFQNTKIADDVTAASV